MAREYDMDRLFKELFYEYKDDLKRMVLKYCGNNEFLAEEAVQQAFFKLFKQLDQMGVEHVKSPRAYLLRSSRNFLYNYHRDNARLQFGDKANVLRALDKEIISIEEELIREERKLAELAILEELKNYNKTWYYVLTEVYLKKRTQKEVADELHISYASMYAILRRVRKWASDNLERRGA